MKHIVHSLLLSMLVVVATGCSEETTSDQVPAGTEGDEAPGIPTEGGESTTVPVITEGGADESCVDADGDGYDLISTICKTGNDCDDGNAEINPGASEICGDSIDQNCDFADESCCEDKDNDGVNAKTALCPSGVDCDDNNPNINPNQEEICGDGVDQDCKDGDPVCCTPECTGKQCGDNGCGGDCGVCGVGATCTPEGLCELETVGAGNCADQGCESPYDETKDCQCDAGCFAAGDCCSDICDVCTEDFVSKCGCVDPDGDGYGEGPTCLGPDCDEVSEFVNPGMDEICDNGVDDNCDNAIDEGCAVIPCEDSADEDGDGFYTSSDCELVDCDDDNENAFPGGTEICGNDVDEDCQDGPAECPADDCVDNDGDQYGEGSGCLGPDCDDNDPFANPGVDPALDLCGDEVDQDCDTVDPVCPETCVDFDEDGYYAISDDCPDGNDCDDIDGTVNPGVDAVLDVCGDGVDQDCQGGDPACSDGNCFSDSDCGSGKWCDSNQGLCVYPKYWQWYAPEVWLETNPDGEDLDFFTTVDFDGDSNAANNPGNAGVVSKDLKVYYSYVKTDTHAYVGYHYYFPKRWSNALVFGTNYDNTMRHVLLVIDIGEDAGTFGTVQAMFTTSESTVREYTNADVDLTGWSNGDIMWSNASGHSRPMIFIESENHDIGGTPGDAGFDMTNEGDIDFPDGNGFKLNWGWGASSIDPAVTENLSGTETYTLVEMVSTLWEERLTLGDENILAEFGLFAGDDTTNDSTTPWGFLDGLNSQYPAGELLWDPATFAGRKYSDGWGVFSETYTYNPYVIKVTLIDVEILEDSELFGNPEPYINLYLRDGRGDEHKMLGLSGGAQNNWGSDGVDPGTILDLKEEMGRNWFYGLEIPGFETMGIEVRENDVRGDDWLMIPADRYYDTFIGVKFLDFLNTNMFVAIEK